MKTDTWISDAEIAIRASLSGPTFLTVSDIERRPKLAADARPDLLVRLMLSDKNLRLLIETAESGQPRFARQAVEELQRYLSYRTDSYGVFLAPYISPRVSELCISEGIGTINLAGNCRLGFENVYIERQGIPNRFSEKRVLRSLYSPKATRVLRALLPTPGKTWRIQELSDEARVSLGQVFNVKKLLLDRELLSESRQGLVLEEPGPLLSEWAQYYSLQKNQVTRFHSPQSIPELESNLARTCTASKRRYALTAFSGAARLGPIQKKVDCQQVTAFVEEVTDDLLQALNLEPFSRGANVNLMTPYDDGVFYGVRAVDGMHIASPFQIYLDLLSFSGPGEEAASEFLEREIQPLW